MRGAGNQTAFDFLCEGCGVRPAPDARQYAIMISYVLSCPPCQHVRVQDKDRRKTSAPTWESELLAAGLRADQMTGVSEVTGQVSGKGRIRDSVGRRLTTRVLTGYLDCGAPAAACVSGKSGSECLIFRPVVPHMQTAAAGAEDGYQDVLGETRHDRSDNVTGNWTQVNSSDVNAVII